MALTGFQRSICRDLAPARKEQESYVAGGVALNEALMASRRSMDIDLFHDTQEALRRTVAADKELLTNQGYSLRFVREAPTFAEAIVSREGNTTLVQWAQDSAFRFFPLLEHDEFGLCLHPFDLATNKVLAMAGRLEPRDWIDLLACHEHLQPVGFLTWAACGKDPGFGPPSLLQAIRRSSRYSQAELDLLDFEGPTPDAAELGRKWHHYLKQADAICEQLPTEHVGTCVLSADQELCTSSPDDLAGQDLHFHQGTIGGAWPTFPG